MLSIIAAVLLATSPTSSCETARVDYEALSLESAVEKAEAELAAKPEHPVDCVEVKALALLVLGRLDEARATFRDLFSRDIEHVVADRSLAPGQRALIEEARENVRPMRATVKARWLVHDLLRLDVLISGGLRDASGVRYELELRPEQTKQTGVVGLVGRVATATAAVPADANISTVALSGRVIDHNDRTLLVFDNESILPPRPPPPEGVEQDRGSVPWFVWVAIGAGVIGASVAIGLLAQPSKPDCKGIAGCFEVPER